MSSKHDKQSVPDQYAQFLALLGRQDQLGIGSQDFREAFLARRFGSHRVGFRRRNLNTGFSANLQWLFPNLLAVDEPEITKATPVLAYGAILDDLEKSHDSTQALLPHVRPDDPVVFFEMGFLASSTSWSEALASRDPQQACLGYIFDDRAQYYMADYETRLDEKLNGDFTLTAEERARAERAMRRIVSSRISKYNSQPFFYPEVSPEYPRRVLVVDQNFSDASTFYGRTGEAEFKAMLEAAIAENPDAEVLIKTHPDLNWVKGGTRRGYYDHLTSEGRVRVIRDGVNPFMLFDMVDKVYVGTSGMGMEALLAGKEVVCFGAPCYAGWGLTDDRVEVPHRHRKRDLVEFFHAFYIWYTIYHVPGHDTPSEIEDVLEFIEQNRPVKPIPKTLPEAPAVSIVIAVHGVERYLSECLASIQRQTWQDYEVILIDDVSPDRSAEIAQTNCDRDPRFRLIRRSENVGPGFARNQGMDLARGTYVLFIDPDDYMPDSGHLSRVIEMADADGADMVRYRKRLEQVEDAQGNIQAMRPDETEAFFPTEVRRTSVTEYPQIAHSRHFWNWLYRRDFLSRHGVRFLTTYREERAFLLQAYTADPVISICDSDGVVYRVRADSAVRRAQTLSDVEDQLENFDQVISQLAQKEGLHPQSPYWWFACFQVSQFLHYLYFGFAWKTACAEGAEALFLERLGATLSRTGMRPHDLIPDPSQLSKAHLRAGAYALLMGAAMVQRRDLVETALTLQPIPAAELYANFLQEPITLAETVLQQALNIYARNERVASSGGATPPSRKVRMILHLGATKTGSTTLQHLLEDNRPALLRQGIWYPEVGLFWQADRPHKQAGHARFGDEAIAGRQALQAHLFNGLNLMPDHVHTVILSSEAFFLNPKSVALAGHFRDFQVEMIVYLRRQDEWANSQYAEFVAGGAISATGLQFKDWLRTPMARACLDYDELLRAWEAELPRSAIHPRRYMRSKGDAWDIVADFIETTGLTAIASLPPVTQRKTNEARLSSAHIELIRRVNNRRFPNKKSYLDFIEQVGHALEAWRAERGLNMPAPWLLTETTAEAIMTNVKAGNARIAADYFGLAEADLFPPRTTPPPECPVYLAEMEIIENAYLASKKQRRNKSHARPVLENYGIFSWRLWSSVPLLAQVYRHRGRPDLAKELRANPAEFARKHWVQRHPRLAWLTFSRRNPLGPRRILRLWLPILKPVVRLARDEETVKQLTRNPVQFMRNLRNPIAHGIGRLLFPMGELRR